MGSRDPANSRVRKRQRVQAWLQSRRVSLIDEPLAAAAFGELPGLSPRLLRQAFLEAGLSMTPVVEGVRQESFEALERTLLALGAEYEAGDTARRGQVRALVITARQHAAWALRLPQCPPARRAEKSEMVLWLRTWLENPPLFATWLALRKRAGGGVA